MLRKNNLLGMAGMHHRWYLVHSPQDALRQALLSMTASTGVMPEK